MKSYFVATTTALAICCSSLAYAADSMNGTTLGEKGVSFSVTGSATLEVPNDSARITWTASTQEKTLEAATKKNYRNNKLSHRKFKENSNIGTTNS